VCCFSFISTYSKASHTHREAFLLSVGGWLLGYSPLFLILHVGNNTRRLALLFTNAASTAILCALFTVLAVLAGFTVLSAFGSIRRASSKTLPNWQAKAITSCLGFSS
jgi:hypothetical protein